MSGKHVIAGVAAIVAGQAIQQPATAAVVTFATPQTISGVSDVSTAGTVLYAYDLGTSASETVGGVTFTGWAPSTITQTPTAPPDSSGNASLATTPSPASGGSFTGAGNGGSSGAIGAINTASSAYFALLDSEVYSYNSSNADTITLTLQNLSPGTQYQVELWVDDSRTNNSIWDRTDQVSSGGNTVTLAYDNTSGGNGVGDYVTGTFTADSNSQAISIVGAITSDATGISPQLGAFDVEVLTPEPASAGLVILGFSALACRRRRHA